MAKPLNEIINELRRENEKLKAEANKWRCAFFAKRNFNKTYHSQRGGAPA